tara:strand:+ start:283 stop:456 length:174 start_codon:yes stop_codon:yes gene_type:complete
MTVQPKKRFRKKTDIEFFIPLMIAIMKGIKYAASEISNTITSIYFSQFKIMDSFFYF